MKLVAAAFAIALAALAAAANAAPPVATTAQGSLQGVDWGKLEIFKGIPYAAPPVGERRWEPPAPPPAWKGVREATKFGSICPQPVRPDGKVANGGGEPQSEDCLYLNVWTFRGARKAPVMVWIHGGAFRFGSGSAKFYDGAAFARDGVVFVSLNYRLGALGWFAHPDLTAAAGPTAPLGDYGLMDQMAALKWVRANIAAFGGDPANVTVFGESAGGASVLALLSTPSAKGLFDRAIVESGGGWGADRSLADAESEGVAMARAAGLGPDATLAQLRALPADKLFVIPPRMGASGPITDGRLMPRSITHAFQQGDEDHVPLIIGSNNYEASLMHFFKIPPAAMLAHAGPLRKLYPASDAKAADDIFTDAIMGAPTHWIAEQASADAPVWLYQFAYVPTFQDGKVPGAQHAGEIPFVFADWTDLAAGLASPQDQAMERLAHGCWVDFARTGRPCPEWPRFRVGSDELMDFGEAASGPVAHFRQAQYEALQKSFLPRLEAMR